MILAINGSPKPQGNLHRMLEKVCRDTGRDYEMVHLARLNIRPCLGCVKCAGTNRCVQKDDMAPLYEKILAAEAFIVGPVVYFGKTNAFTHTFLERLFPLRHVKCLTAGKLAAVVTVGGHEAPQVTKDVAYQLSNYSNYRVVGSVSFNSATPPCFICGFGTTCLYGGPAMWMKPEDFANLTEITPDMFQNFEDHPDIVQACEMLSQELRQALDAKTPD
jgi:multimeric flavodoxin WrbA